MLYKLSCFCFGMQYTDSRPALIWEEGNSKQQDEVVRDSFTKDDDGDRVIKWDTDLVAHPQHLCGPKPMVKMVEQLIIPLLCLFQVS